MKCMIVLAAVLAVSSAQFFGGARSQFARPAPIRSAAPAPRLSSSDRDANVVRYESDISPDGSYVYDFETDNGIAAQERGTPRNFGGNPPVIPDVAEGSFSWTSPEGQRVVVTYVADENGYRPQSDALPVAPTPPPIPPQIQRALEYIARTQRQ